VSYFEVLAMQAAAVGGAMVLLWLVSLPLRNASIVDIAWSLGFVAVAWIGLAAVPAVGPRSWLLAILTTVWGVRLAGYLAWRNLGKGEDKRYTAMRNSYGDSFWIVSLGTVFLLQAALILVVSLPVQVGMFHPEPSAWPLVAAGGALWLVGFLFETVGDYQLARFKADPDNRGKVMDRGLWRYTRHPNYFGDFCVWWGLLLIAVPDPEHLWIAVGPAVMSFLLLRVSGVTLLEKDLSRRPAYADYIRRTSAFFPRPPRESV
jgi:steroid 5-alpha reductase family enzyme